MPLDELLDHAAIERPGPVKRVQGRKVLNILRLKLPTDLLHPGRLKLKHRIGAPFPENSHRFFVVKRYIRPVNLYAKQLLNR